MTAALVGAVFAGALAQRATGMGYALLAAPALVVALGPASGVLLVNVLGIVASLLVLGRVWRDVEWVTFGRLLLPAIGGIGAGTVLIERLPKAWAQVLIGLLILAVLTLAGRLSRGRAVARGRRATSIAGAASGAMGAMAGVGGPAMAVLRSLTRWEHIGFAATLQPYFVVIGTVVVAARLWADPGAWPEIDGLTWVAVLGALFAGIAAGDVVAGRLPAGVAARLVTAVAALGSAWTVVDGLAQL